MKVLAVGLAVILSAGTAVAQDYPAKPIRMIVPLSPGSPVTTSARVVAQHMQAILGQSVVIENRPGAGTTIGAKAVAMAEPDGYTLLYTANGHMFGLYPNQASIPSRVSRRSPRRQDGRSFW